MPKDSIGKYMKIYGKIRKPSIYIDLHIELHAIMCVLDVWTPGIQVQTSKIQVQTPRIQVQAPKIQVQTHKTHIK